MVVERCGWLSLVAVSAFFCSKPANSDELSYEQELNAWKHQRVAFLKGENGYLNLVGLFWLDQPVSSFGSNPGADLVFPASAPDIIGEFQVADGQVLLKVAEAARVMHGSDPVEEIVMRDDLSTDPVVVTSGSLAWTVLNRDRNFAVRLRDFENPAISAFEPIDYFPTNRRYRVTGHLDAYDEPRQVRVDTVIEGLDYKPQSPGLVRFEIDGMELTLEAYSLYDGMLFVFGDRTTGRETYPAGRFLYTSNPDDNGRVTLDFNMAENPPCAFNEFATCPIASRRNRLAVSVPAGEKYDPVSH